MSKENGSVIVPGSAEWFASQRLTDHQAAKVVTVYIYNATKNALGDSFNEDLWKSIYHDDDTRSKYTKEKKQSNLASQITKIAGKFEIGKDDPYFDYFNAKIFARLTRHNIEKLLFSQKNQAIAYIGKMESRLDEFATANSISEDKIEEADLLSSIFTLEFAEKRRILDKFKTKNPSQILDSLRNPKKK